MLKKQSECSTKPEGIICQNCYTYQKILPSFCKSLIFFFRAHREYTIYTFWAKRTVKLFIIIFFKLTKALKMHYMKACRNKCLSFIIFMMNCSWWSFSLFQRCQIKKRIHFFSFFMTNYTEIIFLLNMNCFCFRE